MSDVRFDPSAAARLPNPAMSPPEIVRKRANPSALRSLVQIAIIVASQMARRPSAFSASTYRFFNKFSVAIG